ncbi:hypothetical protein ACWEQL_34365 [Kitasatospora sp. NPDC004240]
MKRIGVSAAAGVLAGVVLVAGCGGAAVPAPGAAAASTAPTATTPPTATTYGCLTADQGRQGAVTVRDGAKSNDAYFQDADGGGAEVAIIFWPRPGGSLCDWVPYLPGFTKAGYAVLAFTSSGDFFDDLGPSGRFLAGRGFSKTVMVGASDTATALLDKTSTPIDGPLKAIVALSAPQRSGRWDAVKLVALGKLPMFLAAGEGDPAASGDARALYEASASRVKRLRTYPGDLKGPDLLKGGALPDVLAFLAEAAPPKG